MLESLCERGICQFGRKTSFERLLREGTNVKNFTWLSLTKI